MKKGLHIDLAAYFDPVANSSTLTSSCTLVMKHAETSYWKQGQAEAIEQEFDGRYGYLYSYEITLLKTIRIPFRVDEGDIHVLYLMDSLGAVVLYDAHMKPICDLSPHRARYIYLPAGVYELEIPQGFSHLFGFYFDGNVFRDGNEREFRFLHEVIRGRWERTKLPIHSIDFLIGPETTLQIQYLCNNLQKGDFDNESFIVHQLTELVQLSKDKVFREYESTSDPELLIQRCREFLAKGVAKNGNKTKIKHIARRLGVSYEYLSRLHQAHHGEKLSDYRDRLLFEHIKALLAQPYSLLDVSIRAGFHGSSELGRFFKKQCGMTPGQYRLRF